MHVKHGWPGTSITSAGSMCSTRGVCAQGEMPEQQHPIATGLLVEDAPHNWACKPLVQGENHAPHLNERAQTRRQNKPHKVGSSGILQKDALLKAATRD